MRKKFSSIGKNELQEKISKSSKNARICSLHFKEEDFVFDSADQQDRRKRKRETIKLVKRRLKDHAYPSMFKNLPACNTYKSTQLVQMLLHVLFDIKIQQQGWRDNAILFQMPITLKILMIFLKKYLKKFTTKNICCIKVMWKLICSIYHHNNLFLLKLY